MKATFRIWFGCLACALTVPVFGQPEFTLEHTVDIEALEAGAVVEFTLLARNDGPAAGAPGPVTIGLSPGLAQPDGTAPYISQGSFDPAEGRWDVGMLQPQASATLVLPAQVRTEGLKACEYARARIELPGDDDFPQSVLAFATLRTPGVERCVDLSVWRVTSLPRDSLFCGGRASFHLWIANFGPDAARDVVISASNVSENFPAPDLWGPQCGNDRTLECVLSELPAGGLEFWTLESWVENGAPLEVRFDIRVTSADLELNPGQEAASVTATVQPYVACPPPPPMSDFDIDLPGGPEFRCFIATAAYGSPLHPHVAALRDFRDHYLLTNAPGRAFTALYYRLSPPMADLIATRPLARALVRTMLSPVVLLIGHPAIVPVLTLVALLLIWQVRRRVRPRCPRVALGRVFRRSI